MRAIRISEPHRIGRLHHLSLLPKSIRAIVGSAATIHCFVVVRARVGIAGPLRFYPRTTREDVPECRFSFSISASISEIAQGVNKSLTFRTSRGDEASGACCSRTPSGDQKTPIAAQNDAAGACGCERTGYPVYRQHRERTKESDVRSAARHRVGVWNEDVGFIAEGEAPKSLP
jgi:hypothetical protein